jgi:hypothetical protein
VPKVGPGREKGDTQSVEMEQNKEAKMSSNSVPLSTSMLMNDYKDATLLMRKLSIEVEKLVRTSSEVFIGSSNADDGNNSNVLMKIERLTSLLDAYRFLIEEETSTTSV